MMRNFGVSNAANSNLSDSRAHNGYFIGSDRKSCLQASASVQAGHPVDCLFPIIIFLLSIYTSLVLSFSFHSLFTWHSHWYPKSSSEASASEALSGGISICKTSLRHQHLRDLLPSSRRMRCKSSSRHQFLTQAAIDVAESKSLSSRHLPFFPCLESS